MFEGSNTTYVLTLTDYNCIEQAFDKDGNGFVSTADIRRMMCGLGEKMSEGDVEFLLNDLTDMNGMVKYADFIEKLCSSEEDWRAAA